MRNLTDAARLTKTAGKILALLEKEGLTDEQVADVMHSTEAALGIKPATTQAKEFAQETEKTYE